MNKLPSSPTKTILYEKLSKRINHENQRQNKKVHIEKENTYLLNNNNNHNHTRNKLKQFNANKRRMNSSRTNSLPISINNKSNSSKKNYLLENKSSSSLTSSFVSSSTNSLNKQQSQTDVSFRSSLSSTTNNNLVNLNNIVSSKRKNSKKRTKERNKEQDKIETSIDYDDLDDKSEHNLKEISAYLDILNNEYDQIKQQFLNLNSQSLNYKKILGLKTPSPYLNNNYQSLSSNPKSHFNLKEDEIDKIKDILLKSRQLDKKSNQTELLINNNTKDQNRNNFIGAWSIMNESNHPQNKRPNSHSNNNNNNNYNSRYFPNSINYFKDMGNFNDNSVHIGYYTESKKYSKNYIPNEKYQIYSNFNKSHYVSRNNNQQINKSQTAQPNHDPIGTQLMEPIANYNANINKLKSHYEEIKQKQKNQIIYSNLCNSNNNFKTLVNSIDSFLKSENDDNLSNKNNPLIIINKENVNPNKVIIEFTEANKSNLASKNNINEFKNSSHHFVFNETGHEHSLKKQNSEDYYNNYDYINNKVITPTNLKNKLNESQHKDANDLINEFDKAMEEINSLLANRGTIKYPSSSTIGNSLQNVDNTKTIETIRKLKVYSPNPNHKYSSIWKNSASTTNLSNTSIMKPIPPKNPKPEKLNPLQIQSTYNNIISSNIGTGNGQLYLQSTSFYTLNSSDYSDINQTDKDKQINTEILSNSNNNLSINANKPTTRLIAVFNRLNQKENRKKSERRQSNISTINESFKKQDSNPNPTNLFNQKPHSNSNSTTKTTNIISKNIITNIAQENWKNLVETNNSNGKYEKYKKMAAEHQNLIYQKQQPLHSQPTKLTVPNNLKL